MCMGHILSYFLSFLSVRYGECMKTSGDGTGRGERGGEVGPGTDLITGSSSTLFIIASLQRCRAGAERGCSSHSKTRVWC